MNMVNEWNNTAHPFDQPFPPALNSDHFLAFLPCLMESAGMPSWKGPTVSRAGIEGPDCRVSSELDKVDDAPM